MRSEIEKAKIIKLTITQTELEMLSWVLSTVLKEANINRKDLPYNASSILGLEEILKGAIK